MKNILILVILKCLEDSLKQELMNRDIMFLGGWNDKSCVVEEHILPLFRKLQELEAENIKIKVFETDHRFSNVRDDLADIIINWIKKSN